MLEYFLRHKTNILEFTKDRQVQLAYGIEDGRVLMTKRFFLTEDNFERKMGIHKGYNKYPMCIHASVHRYFFAPRRAEGVYALDYVIDIDGSDFKSNTTYLLEVCEILKEHGIENFYIVETNGTHEGYQIKIDQEAFMDTREFTPQKWNKLRKFYTYSTFLLSELLKINCLELKIGDEMFRCGWGFNEKNGNKLYIIKNEVPDPYEGEEYMEWVFKMMELEYFKTEFRRKKWKEPVAIRGSKRKYYTTPRYSSINKSDLPPCIQIGLYENVKPGNREKSVFALWRYLSNAGYTKEAIRDYMMEWYRILKERGIADNEMLYKIKEKLQRPLGYNKPLSCNYMKQIGICVYNCGRRNPYE